MCLAAISELTHNRFPVPQLVLAKVSIPPFSISLFDTSVKICICNIFSDYF